MRRRADNQALKLSITSLSSGQSAVAWSDGSQSLGPIHAKDAINQARRFLGVRSDGAHDEFDAVDLGRYRDTADWIPAVM